MGWMGYGHSHSAGGGGGVAFVLGQAEALVISQLTHISSDHSLWKCAAALLSVINCMLSRVVEDRYFLP